MAEGGAHREMVPVGGGCWAFVVVVFLTLCVCCT